jgi:hypothetical protein
MTPRGQAPGTPTVPMLVGPAGAQREAFRLFVISSSLRHLSKSRQTSRPTPWWLTPGRIYRGFAGQDPSGSLPGGGES